jgi:hypothetical protein
MRGNVQELEDKAKGQPPSGNAGAGTWRGTPFCCGVDLLYRRAIMAPAA